MDWFDNGTAVIANLKNMAKTARLARLKGFIWDPEGYGATPHLGYPGPGDKPMRARADVRPFFQIIINPENQVFDRRNQNPKDFDGTWRSAVLKWDKDWQVELALPWTDVGIAAPPPGTTLRANLNRIRPGRPGQIRRWRQQGYDSVRSEVSSWSQYDHYFTEITRLGHWTFE